MKQLYIKIKDMSSEELVSLSKEIRSEIIETSSPKRNTHFSSNLGNVESIIALFKVFNFEKDKIFFDVGHQCYTYKYITSRSLKNIKEKDETSGFPEPKESKFDYNCAGHSGTSIGYAIGSCDGYNQSIAYIGDGCLSSCLSLGSLNYIDNKIIIILNDNNMSIAKTTGTISESANQIQKICNLYNIDYLEVINGHDFSNLIDAYKRAKDNKKSILIHIHTIKGLGFKEAEIDKTGKYHKLSLDIKEDSCSLRVKQIVTDFINSRNDSKIICPATGSFLSSNLPQNKCINVGINEEIAAVYSSGLCVDNIHPFLSLNACFAYRCSDQILYDLALNNFSCTVLVDKCGLTGYDGKTHQGIYDESLFINTPNCVLTMPSNSLQIKTIINNSYAFNGPTIIRYNDDAIPEVGLDCINNKWNVYSNKGENAIVSCGPVINLLINKCKNTKYDLIEAVYLSAIKENVRSLLKYSQIIIYNPYATESGFANALISALIENNFKGSIIKKCIPLEFIEHSSKESQLKDCFLDIETISELIK